MTVTPTDPGAIDLDAMEAQALLAAVEALRARVALLKNDQALGENIITRQEARVAELELLVRDSVRRAGNCEAWQARAEAAEARVAELAGALDGLVSSRHEHAASFQCPWCHARTVLAVTPADVLERARAVETVAKEAKRYRDDRSYGNGALNIALATLDALGKEE